MSMGLKTKYNIIEDAVVRINDLVDAKGVDKCVLIINLVQNLNELSRMLHEEEAKNEAAVLALTEKINKLEKGDAEGADTDTE